MDPASASEFYFVYEPIVSPAGNVLGFEMLTRQNSLSGPCRSIEHLFTQLHAEHKFDIFYTQLNNLSHQAEFFLEHDLCVSLNVDIEIAEGIIRSVALTNRLKRMGFIRLEINERFSELFHARPQPLLTQLAACCPLWLDDFSADHQRLPPATLQQFECIKVDKHFFWQHQGSEELRSVIQLLGRSCQGVIVEGVETSEQLRGLNAWNIRGMQGYLWPARFHHDLQTRVTIR
jgi:EAL domain-containing protein (putative c-di-GMP-specific phosphodiesterase class I)